MEEVVQPSWGYMERYKDFWLSLVPGDTAEFSGWGQGQEYLWYWGLWSSGKSYSPQIPTGSCWESPPKKEHPNRRYKREKVWSVTQGENVHYSTREAASWHHYCICFRQHFFLRPEDQDRVSLAHKRCTQMVVISCISTFRVRHSKDRWRTIYEAPQWGNTGFLEERELPLVGWSEPNKNTTDNRWFPVLNSNTSSLTLNALLFLYDLIHTLGKEFFKVPYTVKQKWTWVKPRLSVQKVLQRVLPRKITQCWPPAAGGRKTSTAQVESGGSLLRLQQKRGASAATGVQACFLAYHATEKWKQWEGTWGQEK